MMKNTGIVRRIDGLGRIVIPKALRENLGIEEGEPLIYSIDKEAKMLGIKKYIPDPPKTEKSVEQKAIEWLAANKKDMENNGAQFSISRSLTSCICYHTRKTSIGKAICSPEDTFSPSIGMIISYCRARNKKIPDFIKL